MQITGLKSKANILADGCMFLTGGILYVGIEILWRGYSHWSMALAGGICFTVFGKIWDKVKNLKRIYIPIIGAGIITSVEFVFGLIFNKILKMHVWDYSDMPFSFLGQICVLFSTLWGLLSIVVFPTAGKLYSKMIN